MRYLILVSLFFVLLNQGVYAQEDSIRIALQSIESLFNSGSYLNAELEGRRLLEYPVNDSVRAEIHKNIAFSLIAQGKTAQAKDQFINLLNIKPDYVLDPVYTSPKILAVFNEAQEQIILSNKIPKEIANKQEVSKDRTAIDVRKVTDDLLSFKSKPISFRTMVFPGWEQLYQDRNRAGSLFLGAGIATLGSGIVFEFLRSSARKDYLSETNPLIINERYDTYDRYYKAEMISLVAFAVVYVASEVDVLLAQRDVSLVINSNSIGSRDTELTITIPF